MIVKRLDPRRFLSDFSLTRRFIPLLGAITIPAHAAFYLLCRHVFGLEESPGMRAAVMLTAVPLLFYPRRGALSTARKLFWEACLGFGLLTFFWYLTFLNDFHPYWFSSTVFAAMIYGLLASWRLMPVAVPLFVAVGVALFGATHQPASGWAISAAQVFAVASLATVIAAAVRIHLDRLYQQLQAANARLRELDQNKSNFFQNISHEFRTPLTLIVGPVRSALEGRYGELSDALERRLDEVHRNARRLLRLINQLLDLSKLEAGAMRPEPEPVDLNEFVRWLVASYRSGAEDRGIELTASVPEGRPLVTMVDRDQLEKVLSNLLSNALKFTDEGGKIRVRLGEHDGEIVLAVKDTGCGIPDAVLPHVFDRFRQGDPSTTREAGGTGIGLALAKELVEAHGGAIDVESEVGFGSEFTVRIPREVPPEPAETVAGIGDDEPERASGAPVELPSPRSGETEAGPEPDTARRFAANAGEPRPAADRKEILVVEDNPDLRGHVARCLEEEGFRVRTARDGREALEVASRARPDLVISDLMMPGMDGLALLRRFRESGDRAGIPFVVLTAKAGEQTLLDALELGADDYLLKPFDRRELVVRAERLIRLRELSEENARLTEEKARDALARFLPPGTVEKVLAGELSLDREPKSALVTVLFSDLAGFTAAAEELRARATTRLLNEHLEAMNDVIFGAGGTVDKFIGDSIMVLFGAPDELDPVEQARRSVECARGMQREQERLSDRWLAEGLPALPMRIGIHQGPTVVGDVGSSRRYEFTAVGSTVNVASRIERICEPGRIYVSAEIADFLAEAEISRVGSFDLEGVAGRVPVFEVEEDRPHRPTTS